MADFGYLDETCDERYVASEANVAKQNLDTSINVRFGKWYLVRHEQKGDHCYMHYPGIFAVLFNYRVVRRLKTSVFLDVAQYSRLSGVEYVVY